MQATPITDYGFIVKVSFLGIELLSKFSANFHGYFLADKSEISHNFPLESKVFTHANNLMKNFFIKFLGNWRHQVSRVEVEELLTKT